MIEFTPEMLDNMTPADFEAYLPELFAAGSGKISDDPRFARFLAANPDCAALVRDLETIAEHARSLFDPVEEPSDKVWSNIASKLQAGLTDEEDLDTGSVAVPTT
jgi:tryptophan 2,3-dioxygenase